MRVCVNMPGANCSLYGCGTSRKHKDIGIFKLPLPKDDFHKQWRQNLLDIILRYRHLDKNLERQINEDRIHICQLHFTDDQLYIYPSRKLLKEGALPTLNLVPPPVEKSTRIRSSYQRRKLSKSVGNEASVSSSEANGEKLNDDGLEASDKRPLHSSHSSEETVEVAETTEPNLRDGNEMKVRVEDETCEIIEQNKEPLFSAICCSLGDNVSDNGKRFSAFQRYRTPQHGSKNPRKSSFAVVSSNRLWSSEKSIESSWSRENPTSSKLRTSKSYPTTPYAYRSFEKRKPFSKNLIDKREFGKSVSTSDNKTQARHFESTDISFVHDEDDRRKSTVESESKTSETTSMQEYQNHPGLSWKSDISLSDESADELLHVNVIDDDCFMRDDVSDRSMSPVYNFPAR